MKSGHSEIIFIADRSGSMNKVKNDMIGGFNSFLDEQKKVPGTCDVTYVQFNSSYELVYEKVNIQEVQPLNENSYVPTGRTALYEAIGRTIDIVGDRYHNTPEEERPENVIVVIMTDGENNLWHMHYSLDKIKQMTEHQQTKYNWNFIYLGANQDAFLVGNEILGMSPNSVKYTYTSSSEGIYNMFREAALPTVNYRMCAKADNWDKSNVVSEYVELAEELKKKGVDGK